MGRNATINRKTNETDINLKFEIDGSGVSKVDTGIGFFDHMLTLFSKHGLFDTILSAKGDLEVDAHHTVEDVGIVIGEAIKNALGDKISIKRYGTSHVVMDEALAMVSLDLAGRSFLHFEAKIPSEKTGWMDAELVEEFFRAVSSNSGMTLHIKLIHGKNFHHIIEAIFKAFGRALDEATTVDKRIKGVMSTKGTL